MREIIVVGSLNADLVQPVSRLPVPGETILGDDLRVLAGGKGANQACAAGLLLGRATMIGQIGDDQFGPVLLQSLRAAHVDVLCVEQVEGSTGTACILVLPSGENVIVVSPGANRKLSASKVRRDLNACLGERNRGSVVLCQLEVPLEATAASLQTARELGATTILDPAPAQRLAPDVLKTVDYLTPNQTEAGVLLDLDECIVTVGDARRAAIRLLELGSAHVILKLGSSGCVIADANGCTHVPGFLVEVVDTTAAGDTFNGAFAAALAEGLPPLEGVRFANAAAALSVQRFGAQASIPTRVETDKFLSRQTVPFR